MAEVIRMPKMSDTMEEGVIASWLKKIGDEVRSGDILAEVETDKATMELEAYEDGTLLFIGVEETKSVPVDGVIAIIGEKNEDIQDLIKEIKGGGASETKPSEKAQSPPVSKEDSAALPEVNASVIKMPKMSDTMTEGTIVSWFKKEGEEVKSGDILAEVETDKATMELEAYEDGTLLYVGVKEGEAVKVDGIIAVIGEKGTDFAPLLKAENASKSAAKQVETVQQADKEVVKEDKPQKGLMKSTSSENGRIKVSPLAKKLAHEKGLDLTKVQGTGDNGRIIKRDIENYTPSDEGKDTTKTPGLPVVAGEEHYEEVPLSQMRKTIARRLAESKFSAPHFYLTMEIDMSKVIAARKSMNEHSPVKISFNDIVIKATAAALRRHPKINTSWLGEKIRYNTHIHIGVAVAVEEGLLVPVVRFADNKSLSQIAAEVKTLADKAKNKQLQPSDWEGNTFTISNLGMFGIEEFTAIINPPDACILAVGGIKEAPVVKDGQLTVGHLMKVTLSCDHRAVDGAVGAAFLQTLKGFLEDPVRILI